MHCHHPRPKVLSPIVSPTKCNNVHDTEVFQVPHIHPSHTTYHHHKVFEHYHSYPHTTAHTTDVAHVNYNCPPAPGAMPGGMPGATGPMPGGMPGAAGPMPGGMPGAAGPMPGGMPGATGPGMAPPFWRR